MPQKEWLLSKYRVIAQFLNMAYESKACVKMLLFMDNNFICIFQYRYPYFIVRIMLAAIDNNMHLFRGNKSSADGSERGHRKFSKRTRRYHSEPIKEEKEYSYFPYIMSRMLKERSEFQGSISQQTDDNVFDPKQIAPTLGMKEPPPTKELMKGPSRFFKDLEN